MVASLNICLISREFPPDTAFGGIATYSCDTALMLKEKGHRVTVFSQSLGSSHVADYQGIKVVKIHIPSPFDSYRRLPVFILSFNTLVMREVMRHHRHHPFDLIDAPDHLAEGLFATFTDIPVVTRLHTPYALIVDMGLNNYKKNLSYWLIKLMEQIALRRSRVLYAPCMDLAKRCDKLFGMGSVAMKVFGYPLDLAFFSPLTGAEAPVAPSRILFLGRLEQRKGIETIVEAFPKVVARHPQATLTLVGNDTPNISGYSSARRYMEAEFERADCLANVRFEGAVPLEKLPAIFHEHDIVWVPSLYDNYPLICLEAMACGKVVVVSDAGGLPEMVREGVTGKIFPARDATQLADITIGLSNDHALCERLGLNARRYTEKICAPETIYSETMKLYQLALGTPKPGDKSCGV